MAVWLPTAGLMLYVKYLFLTFCRGFDLASGYAKVSELSLLQRLSLFRNDLLLVLILIPALLTIAARILARRWRAPFVLLVSIIGATFFIINTRSLYTNGRFLSWELLRSAVGWGLDHPDVIASYLPPQTILRAVMLIGFIGGSSWWASKRDRPGRRRSPYSRILPLLGGAVLLVVIGVAYLPTLPTTEFHRPALASAIHEFLGGEDIDTREFDGFTPEALLASYREMTGSAPRKKDPRFWGNAAGANLLYFVFETGPAKALAIDGDLDDLPNLKRLRETSLIAPRHYSTYPYTNRAVWSMFSSWYPSTLPLDFIERYPDLRVPSSTVGLLAAAGYTTSLFGPKFRYAEREPKMMEVLGFQRQVFGDRIRGSAPDPEHRNATILGWAAITNSSIRMDLDLVALEALKHEISVRDRFVAAYFPQLGHVPIPNFTNRQDSAVPERIRAIMRRQDEWLGEILKILEAKHALDRTLIIVTGDHGVRTNEEDPLLQAGMIDDYSFHVPFLLYAPQAIRQTMVIPWLTSHLDVAPTLGDLLGIEGGRESEQGMPMWDSRLEDRMTYFLGRHYLGADGFGGSGNFAMWSHVANSAYVNNDELHFGKDNLVPRRSSEEERIRRLITRMNALQETWVRVNGAPSSPSPSR